MSNPECINTLGEPTRRRFFRLALGGGVTGGLAALTANPLTRAVKGLSAPKRAEAADEIPTRVLNFIDRLGRNREWRTVNGTDSIPPNTEIRGSLPTILDNINGQEPVLWQASRVLYSANTDSITSLGQRIHLPSGKFYMANLIFFGENLEVLYPRVEVGEINNPADYSTHQLLPTEGLPQGGVRSGMGGVYSLFKLNNDSAVLYLDVGIKNSINTSEDGLYRIRFDDKGLPIGIWVKINPGMSRRYFIPFINNQG